MWVAGLPNANPGKLEGMILLGEDAQKYELLLHSDGPRGSNPTRIVVER
jgi:hypothetical protein